MAAENWRMAWMHSLPACFNIGVGHISKSTEKDVEEGEMSNDPASSPAVIHRRHSSSDGTKDSYGKSFEDSVVYKYMAEWAEGDDDPDSGFGESASVNRIRWLIFDFSVGGLVDNT